MITAVLDELQKDAFPTVADHRPARCTGTAVQVSIQGSEIRVLSFCCSFCSLLAAGVSHPVALKKLQLHGLKHNILIGDITALGRGGHDGGQPGERDVRGAADAVCGRPAHRGRRQDRRRRAFRTRPLAQGELFSMS